MTGQDGTVSAAELLRQRAAEDPEGHRAGLGRGYGVGPHTHGGTDAPECRTCQDTRLAGSDEAVEDDQAEHRRELIELLTGRYPYPAETSERPVEIASLPIEELPDWTDLAEAVGATLRNCEVGCSGEYQTELRWPDGRVATYRDRLAIISADSELPPVDWQDVFERMHANHAVEVARVRAEAVAEERQRMLDGANPARVEAIREVGSYIGPNLAGWPAFPVAYFGGLVDRVVCAYVRAAGSVPVATPAEPIANDFFEEDEDPTAIHALFDGPERFDGITVRPADTVSTAATAAEPSVGTGTPAEVARLQDERDNACAMPQHAEERLAVAERHATQARVDAGLNAAQRDLALAEVARYRAAIEGAISGVLHTIDFETERPKTLVTIETLDEIGWSQQPYWIIPAAALGDGAQQLSNRQAGWMGPPDEFAQTGDGA